MSPAMQSFIHLGEKGLGIRRTAEEARRDVARRRGAAALVLDERDNPAWGAKSVSALKDDQPMSSQRTSDGHLRANVDERPDGQEMDRLQPEHLAVLVVVGASCIAGCHPNLCHHI